MCPFVVVGVDGDYAGDCDDDCGGDDVVVVADDVVVCVHDVDDSDVDVNIADVYVVTHVGSIYADVVVDVVVVVAVFPLFNVVVIDVANVVVHNRIASYEAANSVYVVDVVYDVCVVVMCFCHCCVF